jgi:DNA-nicking Smr family endonuclease
MKSGRRQRRLTEDERVLWSTVARSVSPLPGKAVPDPASEGRGQGSPAADPPPLQRRQAEIPYHARPRPGAPPSPIDRPTRRKIASGRIGIDATVDLHDLTQAQAHETLAAFLRRAQAAGLRHVLVITGKGLSSGEAGVLRKAVPAWLRTAAFRDVVSGLDLAAPHHGGSGAIYVRLRRRRMAS